MTTKKLIISAVCACTLSATALAQQSQQYPYGGPAITLAKHEYMMNVMPVPQGFDMAMNGADCWGETLAVASSNGKISLYRATDNPVLSQGSFTPKGVKHIKAIAFAARPIAKTDKLPLLIVTQDNGKADVVRLNGKSGTVVASLSANGITPVRWIVDAKNGLLLAVDDDGVVAWKMPNLMPKG